MKEGPLPHPYYDESVHEILRYLGLFVNMEIRPHPHPVAYPRQIRWFFDKKCNENRPKSSSLYALT